MPLGMHPLRRPDFLHSITWQDREIYQAFLRAAEGTAVYANSWTYITQACRALGLGWKYMDADRLISIGWHNGHYVLVNPLGIADGRLGDIVGDLCRESGRPVFIKKASPEHTAVLKKAGAFAAHGGSCGWDVIAYADDDTYPEQLLAIDISLGYSLRPCEWFRHYCAARTSPHTCGEHSVRASYRQFRRNIRRLSESGKRYEIREYRPQMNGTIRRWVCEYFGHDRPEAPAAYRNLIEGLHHGLHKESQFCFVVCGETEGGIHGLIFAERLDDESAALYARLIGRNHPGLPEYAMAQVLTHLRRQGIRRLNLGGSETAGLHAFKKKLAPVEERQMQLLVYDQAGER